MNEKDNQLFEQKREEIAKKILDKYDAYLHGSIQEILDEHFEMAKLCWDMLDELTPCAQLLRMGPDGEVPEEPDYYPVFDAGDMIRMFFAGIHYSELKQ